MFLLHFLVDPVPGPLYLTNYIEKSEFDVARKLAEVKPFIGQVKSYSGLLTVDKIYNSNMFFWYFPSETKASRVPFIIWINGRSIPGSFATFLQTGPYDLNSSSLRLKDIYWSRYFNVLYLDNPVGVGYSFTDSIDGYSRTLEEVSLNLEIALEQFLQLFPELKSRELYLAGLSLAGKYIPAFAHRLLSAGRSNLNGIFIGNPLLDINKQMSYENYLYEMGFIASYQRADLVHQQNTMKELLQKGKYDEFNEFSTRFWWQPGNYLENITGLNSLFNCDGDSTNSKSYYDFIRRTEVKKALHVNGISFDVGKKALDMFGQGIGFSSLIYLEDIVSSLKMMFYAGQKDALFPYPMMVDALAAIDWPGKSRYIASTRKKLRTEDGKIVWAYSRSFETLTDVLVRFSGHSVVSDQPKYVMWLLKNFTDYYRF